MLRAYRWPKTAGTFLDYQHADELRIARLLMNKLKYQYVVNGTTYTGTNICFGLSGIFDLVLIFPAVKRIFLGLPHMDVYYDPDKPSSALLVRALPVYQLVKSIFWFGIAAYLASVVRDGQW